MKKEGLSLKGMRIRLDGFVVVRHLVSVGVFRLDRVVPTKHTLGCGFRRWERVIAWGEVLTRFRDDLSGRFWERDRCRAEMFRACELSLDVVSTAAFTTETRGRDGSRRREISREFIEPESF